MRRIFLLFFFPPASSSCPRVPLLIYYSATRALIPFHCILHLALSLGPVNLILGPQLHPLPLSLHKECIERPIKLTLQTMDQLFRAASLKKRVRSNKVQVGEGETGSKMQFAFW